ncbi:MAG TPA: class I SAM-dependent methyltransferase [Steroidobacteraceae bacterium]
MVKRANYGIDAPGQVRGLALFGALATLAGLCSWFVRWRMGVGPGRDLLWPLLSIGAAFFASSLLMVWASKVGKFRVRDRLLDAVALEGNEHVLDVGCGRGLALIGAAKCLTTGRATGIDLWSSKDLSVNTPAAALANAALEGVAERVVIDTGDMCAMPYADDTFDAVVSMTAIHNVPTRARRDLALKEILRVLKPGGRLAIFDIFHPFRYLNVLRGCGATQVKGSRLIFLWALPGRCLFARKPCPTIAGAARAGASIERSR